MQQGSHNAAYPEGQTGVGQRSTAHSQRFIAATVCSVAVAVMELEGCGFLWETNDKSR